MSLKIAIIGSGISGLTAAYLLNRKCEITVFERQPRLGGHTATIDFELDHKSYAIDTGFIVYNDWTYPNFIKLLQQIGVETQPTSMGFSVSTQDKSFEYAGNNLNALFAQRGNVFSPSFLGMLKDIVRFNKQAREDLKSMSISKDMTLGEYLSKNNYSESFAKYYLVPMGAAIWSASLAAMRQFPVHFFVQFFHNHGLLNIFDRPQWRVVKGGSKQYIEPLVSDFKDKIVTSAAIEKISRSDKGVAITFAEDGHLSLASRKASLETHQSTGKLVQHFDQVVFATHSDEALALLEDASLAEKSVLGAIPYCDNSVVLHYDESFLPKRKRAWSSWNYRIDKGDDALPIVTYNMNILQGFNDPKTFCVTLNAENEIDPSKIIEKFSYAHPQFSIEATHAQDRWSEINGVNNTWYCGAYWANGFHEDGVTSALRVAEQFGEFL